MTLQLGKQTTAILPKIKRSKGNQPIKFGQLIEFNMKNVFLQKSCTKFGALISPRLYFAESKLSTFLDQ